MTKKRKTLQVGEYPMDELESVPVKTLKKRAKRLTQTHTLDHDKTLADLKSLVEIVALAEFALGELMMRLSIDESYIAGPFPDLDSFAKEHLGMAPSTATRRMNAYRRYRMCGMPFAEMPDVGWAKLRLFAPHLTEWNALDWWRIASDRTLVELSDYIRRERPYLERMDIMTSSVDLLGADPTHDPVSSRLYRYQPTQDKDTVKDAATDVVLQDA